MLNIVPYGAAVLEKKNV